MLYNRKIIGLCVARIQDDATNEFITALNRIASPEGYSIFVYNTCSAVEEDYYEGNPQTYIYEFMDFSILDIVIVYEEVIRNQVVSDALIERAKSHGVPVIVIGEQHEGCINIKFDHANEFGQVVRHMIQVHHLTRLHFMAGFKGNQFSEYRLEAFKKVLEENNLPFDYSMVSYGDFYSVAAARETEKLIAAGNLPQAILCANDRMAIAVCGTLNKYGIRVPEDVAVTGFDGITEINVMSPRITSVICDADDMALKTLEIIREINQLSRATKTCLVSPKLCIAESCGCSGEKTRNASEYLNTLFDRLYRFQEEELMLSRITAQVQRCESLKEIAVKLKQNIIYDMCCIVEKEYLDQSVNPVMHAEKVSLDDKKMTVVFDSDWLEGEFIPYDFPAKGYTPHADYMVENGRILVFTALHHTDVPIGYVCFFFSEISSSNYMKIPQTVTALNNAIGGYRNLQHKHFLMNQIDEMYRTDALTGLLNRRGFEIEYQKLRDSDLGKDRLTIVMADLDRLKYINDTFGHKEGDFAIHAVAQALVSVCPEDSLFTRFGGDEMLAVCYGKQDTNLLKEKFAQYFKELNAKAGKDYPIAASVGISITEENEILEFEELLERSDRLMYEEKKERKKLLNR